MSGSVFQGPSELSEFVDRCEAALLTATPQQLVYPPNSSAATWPVDQIRSDNKTVLRGLRHSGNVYAIFVKDPAPDATWQIRYVGERKADGLRTRISEHLIKKDARTGSKLTNVQDAVADGKLVGITYIKVEPESLRLFVEETIIARNRAELHWNSQG